MTQSLLIILIPIICAIAGGIIGWKIANEELIKKNNQPPRIYTSGGSGKTTYTLENSVEPSNQKTTTPIVKAQINVIKSKTDKGSGYNPRLHGSEGNTQQTQLSLTGEKSSIYGVK